MSQTAQIPQEIQRLLEQQQEIEKKLESWKKKQHLRNIAEQLKKKRGFTGLKCINPPKKLKRCFHNIQVIQDKEKELAKERNQVKEECIQLIENYLNEEQSN